jgi:hypothetical protein
VALRLPFTNKVFPSVRQGGASDAACNLIAPSGQSLTRILKVGRVVLTAKAAAHACWPMAQRVYAGAFTSDPHLSGRCFGTHGVLTL